MGTASVMTYYRLLQHYHSYISKVSIKNETAGCIKAAEPELGTVAGGRLCNEAAEPLSSKAVQPYRSLYAR